MAGSLLPEPKQQFLNDIGVPLFGGKIYTYEAGTLTPKPTYQDKAQTSANTNPVIANARGEVLMFGSGVYRVILKDSSDNLIYDVDNIDTAQSISDVILALLAAPNGASLIGFGTQTVEQVLSNSFSVVSSVAAVSALDVSKSKIAFTTGYYTSGDPGGGRSYRYDAASTATVDQGAVLAALGGVGRWHIVSAGPLNQYDFGAKGTGLIADNDTDALQRWWNWAISGGTGAQRGIHGKAGRHYISGTGVKVAVNDAVPTFTSDGATNFVLTGDASIYMDFSAINGSGQTSQARLGAIGIEPVSKITGSIGLLIRGLCSVTFVDWRFNKLNASCIMHNDKAGSFTELVVLENPYFDTSVDGFIWYRVTAGNQSFRSSGVVNGKGNIGQGCLPIVFEPNAVNYFGRCDLTVWNYSTNCVLITNQSTQQNLIGNITAEPLKVTGGPAPENNKLTLATGPSTVYLLGRLAAWAFKSTAVFKGVLTVCREFSNMTDLGQRSLPENDSGSFTTTSVGEPFAIKYSPGIELPFSPDSAIITIVVTAPGYLWKGYYAMRTGTTPTVVNASPIYAPDLFQTGVAYGNMVVTQGTSRNINVTNPNSMPVGTVLTYNIEYTHGLIPNF